jgi:hypothetical protein
VPLAFVTKSSAGGSSHVAFMLDSATATRFQGTAEWLGHRRAA